MWSREDTLRNAIWNSQHCKPIFFYKANSNDVCFVQLVCFLDCAIGYPLYAGHVSVLLTSTYRKSWKSWNKERTSIFWKSFHLAVIYLDTGQCADNLMHLLLSGYLGSFYSYSMHHVILCFHVIYPRHQPKLSFMFAKHWPYLLRGKGRSNLSAQNLTERGEMNRKTLGLIEVDGILPLTLLDSNSCIWTPALCFRSNELLALWTGTAPFSPVYAALWAL